MILKVKEKKIKNNKYIFLQFRAFYIFFSVRKKKKISCKHGVDPPPPFNSLFYPFPYNAVLVKVDGDKNKNHRIFTGHRGNFSPFYTYEGSFCLRILS